MTVYFVYVLGYSFAGEARGRRSERRGIAERMAALADSYRVGGRIDKVEWYSSLRPDTDMIVSLFAKDTQQLIAFKSELDEIMGIAGRMNYGFFSMYQTSKGLAAPDKEHKYFVAYPMSKSNEWYMLDGEKRDNIMKEHIRVAADSKNNDQIISYTTKSHGVSDYEFVVIYELKSIEQWIEVTRELRSVEARRWVVKESPILVGERGMLF